MFEKLSTYKRLAVHRGLHTVRGAIVGLCTSICSREHGVLVKVYKKRSPLLRTPYIYYFEKMTRLPINYNVDNIDKGEE